MISLKKTNNLLIHYYIMLDMVSLPNYYYSIPPFDILTTLKEQAGYFAVLLCYFKVSLICKWRLLENFIWKH